METFKVYLTFNSFAGYMRFEFLEEANSAQELRDKYRGQELEFAGRDLGRPTRVYVRRF